MANIFHLFALIQTDTLTQSYADKWQGGGEAGENAIMAFMNSNDLIFVVLGVSLIIWFVLIFFLIRLDKKIQNLEQKVDRE